MPATVTPLPTRLPDPANQSALAELVQLGLAVARLSSRLAEVENAALDILADAAIRTTQAIAATPASLEDAIRTGREADAMDVARDAVAARVDSITRSFDKAARAVRRTAALQARLATGRPFAPPADPSRTPPAPHGRPASGARPANDTDSPDRTDGPDDGDEIGPDTNEELLRAVRRDLAGAASHLARQPGDTPARRLAGMDPPTRTASPPPGPGPMPARPPAPDT